MFVRARRAAVTGWLVSALVACGASGDTENVGFKESGGGQSPGGAGGAAGSGALGGRAGNGGKAGKGGSGATSQGGAGGSGQEAGAGQGGEAVGGAGAGGATGEAGAAGQPLGAPYPIVLAHGFFGFEAFAGVDFVTYFFGVKARLNDEGETEVFTPAVDPFNDSTTRGKQLLAHVEEIVKQTGRGKVNLIGHSQGGLDARVVAALRPDLVASVTTFATPHRGTRVADVVTGVVSDPNAQDLLDQLVKLVGIPLYDAAGNETSLSKSMQQLSTKGCEQFNATYLDQPGIPYRSFTGRSKDRFGGSTCDADNAPEFVTKYKLRLDPLEQLLTVPGIILDGIDLLPKPHDGLVPAESAKWGEFLGCVPADHFDEIGHLFGDKPGLLNDWDHREFYSGVVKLLRAQGL